MAALKKQFLEFGQFAAGNAFKAMLLRFQMHTDPDAGEIKHRRNRRRFNDFDIGNTHELSHQEGCRTHDRRHQLTAGRGRRFDRPGKFFGITHFFHHRDGETTGTDNVADRAA